MSSTASNGSKFHDQLRPAWTPLNITIMVVSFVVGAWPVGLFMIAYIIWGAQWGLDFSQWGRSDGASRMKSAFSKAFDGTATSSRTGNRAFDEWRDAELKRIEEERQKLEAARREFEEYLEELKKARDRDEFDRFKARWDAKNGGTSSGDDTVQG